MYKTIKRILDILFALIALIILSPLLIPIVIGLRFTGEGNIWYFQERIGYKNSKFKIFKFATMLENSENMAGGIITLKNDSRITPMGGFLRKSKINELPQLINILIGDMSFTGPRPVMEKSFNTYPEDIKKILYDVKPGLTGIGSIIFRDEEDLITKVRDDGGDTWKYYENVIYPFKGEVEKWYQNNYGFLTDFKIVCITAWVIIFPKSNLVYKVFKKLPKRNY
jgi:lipopolysaccharide/colanic/teichoic acid biosynthesis glycosyltransferase